MCWFPIYLRKMVIQKKKEKLYIYLGIMENTIKELPYILHISIPNQKKSSSMQIYSTDARKNISKNNS